jgi:hypothetical protein
MAAVSRLLNPLKLEGSLRIISYDIVTGNNRSAVQIIGIDTPPAFMEPLCGSYVWNPYPASIYGTTPQLIP